MEQLYYKSYKEFVGNVAEKYDGIAGKDKFDDISIIAKYSEAKQIIRELIFIGYDISSIEISDEEFDGYYDEYIISLGMDKVWCEKFKRSTGYITDISTVIFVMDNCSSGVLSHLNSNEIYEVSVGSEEYSEETSDEFIDEGEQSNYHIANNSYYVNGRSVNKEEFDKYVSKVLPNLTNKSNVKLYKDKKCDFVVDTTLNVLKEMEQRMTHINEMLHEKDCFRRLFTW